VRQPSRSSRFAHALAAAGRYLAAYQRFVRLPAFGFTALVPLLGAATVRSSLPSWLIGGLLGDFVKGLLPAGLPPALASGVALHRAIDSFADRHPAFIASRRRVSAERRRVSGVLVDLFYDHLLARDWPDYGSGTLESYTARLYASLDDYAGELPAKAREAADLMRRSLSSPLPGRGGGRKTRINTPQTP